MNTGKIVLVRLGIGVVAIAGVAAFGDPPLPPDPPVQHSNQGRNVDDEVPKISSRPIHIPINTESSLRGIWIPPDSTANLDIDRLTLPEIPMDTLGGRLDVGGSVTVTPAPSTLGILALGGLAMCRRRRRG